MNRQRGVHKSSNCVIEATVSIEPMPKYRNDLSIRRRAKRKDHRQDDVPDAPSLKDIDFYIEPPVESPSQNFSPYATEIDPKSPVSDKSSVKEISFCSNGGSSHEMPESNATQRHARSEWVYTSPVPNEKEPYELPTKWPFIEQWQKHSSPVSPFTYENSTSQTHMKKRKQRLYPSPLARGVSVVLENMGGVAAEFFIHLCHLTSKAISFQRPIGMLLLLVCLYYSIIYLEVSLANSAEIVLEWVWPVAHMTLRAVERCLRSVTNFVQGIDELGESVVCDWAQLWCAQFDLMCHQRCSFTSRTLERLRH